MPGSEVRREFRMTSVMGTLGGAFGLRAAFAVAAVLILLNLPIRAQKKRRDEDQR